MQRVDEVGTLDQDRLDCKGNFCEQDHGTELHLLEMTRQPEHPNVNAKNITLLRSETSFRYKKENVRNDCAEIRESRNDENL